MYRKITKDLIQLLSLTTTNSIANNNNNNNYKSIKYVHQHAIVQTVVNQLYSCRSYHSLTGITVPVIVTHLLLNLDTWKRIAAEIDLLAVESEYCIVRLPLANRGRYTAAAVDKLIVNQKLQTNLFLVQSQKTKKERRAFQ